MPLTQARVRVIFRWVHIVLGLVLLCYVYSPLSSYLSFRLLVKIVAIPVTVFSGLWLWKFKFFNRLFGIK